MKVVEVLPAALPMTTLYPSFSLRGMIRPHVRRGTCDVSARDTKLRQTDRVFRSTSDVKLLLQWQRLLG